MESGLKGWKVVLETLEREVEVELEAGVNAVGRLPSFKVADTRVSRKQLEVHVQQNERYLNRPPVVTLTPRGVNPSKLRRDEEDDFQPLQKDQSYEIFDGDIFTMVMEDYPFRLRITKVQQPSSSSIQPTKRSQASSSSSSTLKKARLDHYEDGSHSAEEEEEEAPLRRKVQSSKRAKDEDDDDADLLSPSPSFFSSPPHSSSSSSSSWDEHYSLAFPSFSTATFQFDLEKAIPVACKAIYDFLRDHLDEPRLRLLLVDTDSSSTTLKLFQRHWNNSPTYSKEKRFLAIAGDITQMKTKSQKPCSFIANSVNWRFSLGGGVNRAINNAAGPSLQKKTKQLYSGPAKIGKAYPVELPESSPLRKNEEVRWVLHVLGPNMNPERPNCLNGDYEIGCKQLSQAYWALFDSYLDLVKREEAKRQGQTRDAFGVLLGAAKSQANNKQQAKPSLTPPSSSSSSSSYSAGPSISPTSTPPRGKSLSPSPGPRPTSPASGGGKGGWSSALLSYVRNPEQHSELVMFHYDDDFVVIWDLYPKAKFHLLLMPRRIINGPQDLTKADLPMLEKMELCAQSVINKLKAPSSKFQYGFHAIPSMTQLHCHIISQDFDSSYMKTKKHWNSFTTDYFIPFRDLKNWIAKHGKVQLQSKSAYEAMLKETLRCHRCHKDFSNIPTLKRHLSEALC